MAAIQSERVLVVSNDPDVVERVVRQSLRPLRYQVRVAATPEEALEVFAQFAPDLALVDLDLPGLSAQDLLAAWRALGGETPVIVMAPQGREKEILQSIRLGAVDYLTLPAREPEVVVVVERALKGVRQGRERRTLARQLEQRHRDLARRVQELDLLLTLAKTLPTLTRQGALYQHVVDKACEGLAAEVGWLALKEGTTFRLVAQRALPKPWNQRGRTRWDDGLSPLVALSGEPLNLHGESLRRFKASRLGQALLVVPLEVEGQSLGVVGVARREPRPFSPEEEALLRGIADLAALAMVNLKGFWALHQRAQILQRQARVAQMSLRLRAQVWQAVTHRLPDLVTRAWAQIEALESLEEGEVLSSPPWQTLKETLRHLQEMASRQHPGLLRTGAHEPPVDWAALVRQAARRHQTVAREKDVRLEVQVPSSPQPVEGDALLLEYLVDHLLANALYFTPSGGGVWVRLRTQGAWSVLTVRDTGPDPAQASLLLEAAEEAEGEEGVGLALVKEIAEIHGGSLRLESAADQGAVFRVRLPLATH